MLHIFMTAVNAVVPIMLLILTGYILRQKNILNDNFLKVGNALVFKVCLPSLFFVNIYEIRDLSDIPWDTVIYCTLGVINRIRVHRYSLKGNVKIDLSPL